MEQTVQFWRIGRHTVNADHSLLFTCHPDPMWVYDLETLAFLAVNDAAIRAYGYTRQEFLGMTIRDIHPTEDIDRLEQNISALDSGIDQAGSWTHIHKSGARRTVDITSEVIEFMGRRAELVCARDVTEQRAMTERLAQARKLEAIGILTGGIAHDFNNLLTVILGNSELICELTKSSQEGEPLQDIHELASMVTLAAERGAALTQKLLTYARRQTLAPRLTDVNKLIRNIDPALRQVTGPAIALKLTLEPALWLCHVDPQRLETVIQDLVINSVQAMPSRGSVEIGTANVVLCEPSLNTYANIPAGEYVLLSVSDDGHGIPGTVMERIFEPFFTTRAAGKHSGLGLSVVHGFVKQSAAHIHIASSVGQGTTVSLYFPMMRSTHSDQSQAELATPETSNPAPSRDNQGESILVVEDDLLVRRHVTSLLSAEGYQVKEASGPDEALSLLAAHPEISLLLTDVFLGTDMDGRQLAEHAQRLRKGLRVLFCSGYSGLALSGKGGLPDGTSLVSKPYTRDALLDAVWTTLKKH